jgi:hypothetical protein
MKLTIESTDKLTEFPPVRIGDPPVPCRVWNGTTEDGTTCLVFIHRIAVPDDGAHDQALFEKHIKEQLQPGQIIPLRFIL